MMTWTERAIPASPCNRLNGFLDGVLHLIIGHDRQFYVAPNHSIKAARSTGEGGIIPATFLGHLRVLRLTRDSA